MNEMFCYDCWAWVDTVQDEEWLDEAECAECGSVNLYDCEAEAKAAGRYDADERRGEMERDEMMFAMMD